jgi:hypothetical protein
MSRLGSKSYKEFFPWVDIASWSIQRRVFPEELESGFARTNFLGISCYEDRLYKDKLYLDRNVSLIEIKPVAIPLASWLAPSYLYDDVYPEYSVRVTVVAFLLVQELSSGEFSRIGIWWALQDEDQQTTNVKELLDKIAADRTLGHTAVIEKRTLRLL